MWIVRLALRRPYTFVVMALLIVHARRRSPSSRTPTDIFPDIDIPVVSVDLDLQRAVDRGDGAAASPPSASSPSRSAVNDIEHIESQTLNGVAVIKIYFQPDVNIAAAHGPGDRACRRRSCAACRPAPCRRSSSATTPSSVPILQMSLSSDTLSRGGALRLRHLPHPPAARRRPGHHASRCPTAASRGRSWSTSTRRRSWPTASPPQDVNAAINAQNLDPPDRHGEDRRRTSTRVSLNSSPEAVAALNDIPIKRVNGATVYVRDVGHVHDGFAVQTNMVRADGRRVRAADGPEERQRLHPRHRQAGQGAAARHPGARRRRG